MDIRSGQELAWENKLARRFNTTNIPLEFCLLQVEIAEAFHEWRKGGANIGEELAPAAINLLGPAGMTGVDFQAEAEVEAKLAKNSAHIYPRQPDDVLAKNSGESG